jgi:nucleolar protein 14
VQLLCTNLLQKSIFNLADDEVLTHRGQTLSEMEKFDDPRSDDEEEEEGEEKGKLGGEYYYTGLFISP